ncbi:hypothetical protein ACO22_04361 [Paracoccidioides brasiliensis]|uniref:Uncharacterized protein n=1 Tax=Paracoccidioides brasiliensis TaxID=121759 RepID=A0A1D2JD91_PARBR|nr:hypothetical protein ACO22_04361 [Paracoccidioides brasiliensis]
MDEMDEVDEVDEVDEMDEVGEEVIDGWMMLVTEVEKYPIGQITAVTVHVTPARKHRSIRSFSQLPMDWPKLPGMRKEAHVAATTKTQHPIVSKTPNRVISNHIHT